MEDEDREAFEMDRCAYFLGFLAWFAEKRKMPPGVAKMMANDFVEFDAIAKREGETL